MKKTFKNIFIAGLLFAMAILTFQQVVLAGTTTSTGATTVSGSYPEPTGGGGNPSGDTAAPSAISNLSVVSAATTVSSITLTWTAPGDDGISGTAASYDARYSTSAITDANWATANQASNEPAPKASGGTETFTIPGLAADTTYYFTIKTLDEVPNISLISNIISVKTLIGTQPDITPPIISNVQAGQITGVSARITWLTNESATSSVIYGKTLNYEFDAVLENVFVTSHIVNLTGLTSETLYHYKVKSADASFNEAGAEDKTFTTADVTATIISAVTATPQVISAAITWTTDEVTDSQVAYGETNQLGLPIVSDINLVVSHSIGLSNLKANFAYYYRVGSTDAAGNPSLGSILTFKTNRDANPPANVSNFKALAGDGQISLSWSNPSDTDFAGVIVRKSTTAYPDTPAAGQAVYDGKGIVKTDIGLTNGVVYYYSAFAYDTSGNFASGAIDNAVPTGGGQPPGVKYQCNDGIDNDSDEKIDYPADLGCSAPTDNDETDSVQPPLPSGPGAPSIGAPSNGGPEAITFLLSDFNFNAAKGKITVPSDAEMPILPGASLIISLDSTKLSKPVKSFVINLDNNFYLFQQKNSLTFWSTEINLPTGIGKYLANIVIDFQDGNRTVTGWQVNVLPFGKIYEKKNGQELSVVGAKVSLLTSPTLWPAEAYGQSNPQIVGEDGKFSFLAPPGKYILKVEKEGYQTLETGYFSSNGVVINNDLEILATPPKLADVIKSGDTLTENVVNVAKNLEQKTVFTAKVASRKAVAQAQNAVKEIGEFTANPVVKETTQNVVAPVIAGAAAVGATAAVGFSQFLLYLRFLFTQPILMLFRRRRRGWGVVYNALTKIPLDLVTIRLIDAVTNRVIQSKVTDKDGRYAFLPLPGKYKIETQYTNFKFPTAFLSSLKEDGTFLDIYHGEAIEVKDKGAIITPNVPLDPAGQEKPIGKILWQLLWRRLQHIFSVVSLILSAVFLAIIPGVLTAALLAIQIIFYLLFLRLAYPKRPKSWGIVYNEHNKKPLERAVVRVFDNQYNKLLETQITDQKGRYSFLVGRNEYYMFYEKNGFEKKQGNPINLKNNPEPTASLGVDTGLKPEEQKKIGDMALK